MSGETLIGLAGFGALGYLLLSLRSYVKKKGENQATKEDMAAITREVEKVKHEYAAQLETIAQQDRLVVEAVKQRHDLRLAALDRRLIAHQEAYSHWWNLLLSVHDKDEVGERVRECQDWFVKNRLYLEPEVADAFSEAYQAAFVHRDLVDAKMSKPEILENWEKIRSVGSIVVAAVKLPALSGGEPTPLNDEDR